MIESCILKCIGTMSFGQRFCQSVGSRIHLVVFSRMVSGFVEWVTLTVLFLVQVGGGVNVGKFFEFEGRGYTYTDLGFNGMVGLERRF